MANTYLPSTLKSERVVTGCVTFADAPMRRHFLSNFLAKCYTLTILKLHTQRNYNIPTQLFAVRSVAAFFV